MIRLESNKNMFDQGDSKMLKGQLRKVERDRDVLKGDIVRLEEERDALKERLKTISESQTFDQAKFKNLLAEAEAQVTQLENERRELMQAQGSRRATISTLEDQCRDLKEQLKSIQIELTQQRSNYSQLKNLHEQTDQALADSQSQIIQLEAELGKYRSKAFVLGNEKQAYDQEVSNTKKDITMLRDSLLKLDEEKDSLLIIVDEKTEKLNKMEEELRSRENHITRLQGSELELKKKLADTMDSSSSREQLLKKSSLEIGTLQRDLDTLNRNYQSSVQENRRLQNELATYISNCRSHKQELETSQKHVEDLKRQLQHYVAEVKRFEDLMGLKESERSELLTQFKNLSEEAVLLENNNHSLENEATQSKVQLSVTLDHVAELENKLTCQCNLISGYEEQINELKTKVSNLDRQLNNSIQNQKRAENDLSAIRDLCLKLDRQKDNLMHELNQKDSQQLNMNREISKMKTESEELLSNMEKDRMTLGNLEQLLGEARQESVQLKLCNQELESEVKLLKEKLEDMQQKLYTGGARITHSTNIRPPNCQCFAANYSERNMNIVDSVAFSYDLECKCCGKQAEVFQMSGETNESPRSKSFQDKSALSSPNRYQLAASHTSDNLTSTGPEKRFTSSASTKHGKGESLICPVNTSCLNIKNKNDQDKYNFSRELGSQSNTPKRNGIFRQKYSGSQINVDGVKDKSPSNKEEGDMIYRSSLTKKKLTSSRSGSLINIEHIRSSPSKMSDNLKNDEFQSNSRPSSPPHQSNNLKDKEAKPASCNHSVCFQDQSGSMVKPGIVSKDCHMSCRCEFAKSK